MLAVRLVNRRRNRLRPIAAFAYPCCRPATGLIRAYSDGGQVIATNVTGGSKAGQKNPKTAESTAEATKSTKKPRKQRSDAGTSRGGNNSGNPPKPRTPSTKPRKKRSDAGVLKGPLLKKAFEDVLHGARTAIPEGEAETDSVPSKRKSVKSLSRIAFGKRGDKARQNIIGEELCDDIIQRLAPSLEKHKGCDIIDINPGVGLWSSKLHDIVKPRTHILMEPDSSTYKPYLEPLLNQKDSTYKLLPMSGIIWNNLNKLERDGHLPHQTLLSPSDPSLEKPNTTLLVTANLGYWPRRPYIGFPSITTLVVHQLLTATRAHSVFQGYGQVRMLIWMHDLEKRIVLPRLIINRRKSSIEAEISCEYIHEVAGGDLETENFRREQAIDMLSGQRVAPAMAAAGLHTPPHREGIMEREARTSQLAASTPNIGVRRPFEDELTALEERYAAGEFPEFYDEVEDHHVATPEVSLDSTRRRTEEFRRLQALRWRLKAVGVVNDLVESRLDSYEALENEWVALRASNDPKREEGMARVEEGIREWRRALESGARTTVTAVTQRLEERRGFLAEPALLVWDRRAMEPLIVKPSEFAPAQPMALLDFQPRSIWPSLRAEGLGCYDYFEFMLAALFIMPKQSVVAGLRALAPGAEEWILPRCPALRDVGKGGVVDLEMLTVRSLTEGMLREMFEEFMRWPFRPSKAEMVARGGSQDLHGDGEGEMDKHGGGG
ncbi:hypothetical protein VE01_08674 [Pseudogymnoascus verrucosus]|uniref:Mitochondrial transcription factor 1 n=1 Tax=Pseudogymnoascus verrucosus TaxID=342668 RepID=A0A1B8GCF7_9PEZI|nr:uncharacterized protein VE01_08674 [Pseudogymnoascus verrucosus]OBT93503.1 hypothetical protein VE01_08674 [Pseudogymnoascus verrucosus]